MVITNNTSNGADRFHIAKSAGSQDNTATNVMRSGNINYTAADYSQNDFLTYLLQKSFLENGEPSTVFMRF